jgi:hypothetical protein
LNGAWYGLTTVAIALVVRWLILNDPGSSRRKRRAEAGTAIESENTEPDRGKKSKRWRAGK